MSEFGFGVRGLSDGFFTIGSWVWVVWDGFASLVPYCDEKVVECVGYVLGLRVCFIFVLDYGW